MVYGPDGETPVEDDELTSHLDDSMYEICYISIPLYNTSTYAFADDDQKAEMLKLAQAAADSVNAAGGETVSDLSLIHICIIAFAEVVQILFAHALFTSHS